MIGYVCIWIRSWDRDLIRARGVALGQEFRGKGVNVALGKSTSNIVFGPLLLKTRL